MGNAALSSLSKDSVVLFGGDWAGHIKVTDYVVPQF